VRKLMICVNALVEMIARLMQYL